MRDFTKAGAQSKRMIDHPGVRTLRAVMFAIVSASLFSGCAAQKAYRFTAKSVTRINYNPNHCTELADGRYKCKDVVFTVATIDASATK